MRILGESYTSTVTGKLQTTIPAKLAKERGIQAGVRLIWRLTDDPLMVAAEIVPDAVAELSKAQAIAAKDKRAGAKLMKIFEEERAWQRANGPVV